MIIGLVMFFALLLLLSVSYAYQLTLAMAVFTLIVLGVLVSVQHAEQVNKQVNKQDDKQGNQQGTQQENILYHFQLSQHGLCVFNDEQCYQLQANSRYSFLGCWLILLPIAALNKPFVDKKEQLFIYRDSLSKQDFSRLSQVLKNLEKTAYSS